MQKFARSVCTTNSDTIAVLVVLFRTIRTSILFQGVDPPVKHQFNTVVIICLNPLFTYRSLQEVHNKFSHNNSSSHIVVDLILWVYSAEVSNK